MGESVTVQVCFDDPNGEMLAYRVVSSDPAVATAVATGSTVTVTAVAPGVALVTMIATDPTGLKAQQSFRVVVPNRPPTTVGTIDDRELMVGDSATLDVSGYFSDPDGQNLAYSAAVSDSSRLSVAVETATVTIVAVAKGDVVVTVTATDPGGLSASLSFLVTVPNRPPIAVDSIAARIVAVDRADTVEVSPFFSDPDGDTLTYAATVSDSAVVSASVAGSAVVVAGLAKGEVEVTVTATDDEGLSAEQRFTVTVPNRPPIVADTIPARMLFKDEADTLTLAGHFTDPDGDALAYAAEASDSGVVALAVSAAEGTLVITAVGQGQAEVTVTATDPEGLAAVQSFLVTVPNRGPVVGDEIPAQTLNKRETATLDLSPHFRDPDGDALTYVVETTNSDVVTAEVAGAMLVVKTGTDGEATLTVTATDPGGLSASQSFSVTVVNRPPVVTTPIPEQTIALGAPGTVDLSLHFTDPDGDALAYAAKSSDPLVVTVLVGGTTLTLRARAKGVAEVTVTATDTGGLTAAQSFTVIVANRAPMAVGRVPDLTLFRDENLRFSISDYFSDPDGDVLTYSGATANPGIARVSVSGAAATLMGVAAGETTLTLTATDPEGLTATQTSQLEVTARGGGGFNLDIRYHSSATAAVRTAISGAASSWESILSASDFPAATTPDFTCALRGVSFSVSAGTSTDDIMIMVGAAPIDGSASPSVAASARVCAVRRSTGTPAVGVIVFDSADLDNLERRGVLGAVAVHEIGHILGIGQTSAWYGSIEGASDADPHFAGTLAIAAFNAAGGSGYSGAKVPVESSSDLGHWRESVLGGEIMTPRLSVRSSLSTITIQALADMGYSVDISLADAFTLTSPDAADIVVPAHTVDLHGDFERGPVLVIDEDGNVVRVIPGASTPPSDQQPPPTQPNRQNRR